MSVAPRENRVRVRPARKLPQGPSSFANQAQIETYPVTVVHGVTLPRTPKLN